MRLPPFLEFLRPRLGGECDGLAVLGHLRIERTPAGGPTELVCDERNYIVNQGLSAVRDMLIGSSLGINKQIFRMAIGDGGSTVGALFTPKLPDETWATRTALYEEVMRVDMASFEQIGDDAARFVANFNSTDALEADFTLPNKVINEAALIVGDGVAGGGIIHKADTPDADEKVFSVRTFKSAPFDPAEDVTLSFTWTITVAR